MVGSSPSRGAYESPYSRTVGTRADRRYARPGRMGAPDPPGDGGRRPRQDASRRDFRSAQEVIVTERNWPNFERLLGPKALFQSLMENVREIRNRLAHFRGRLDAVQHQALLQARDWLGARPKPPSIATVEEQRLRVEAMKLTVRRGPGTFEPMTGWLEQQQARGRHVRVSFQDIEALLDQPLPAAARQHRSWWANDPSTNRQCLSWMRAGWSVEDIDLAAEEVVFHRTDTVLQQLFFADLLERMKKARPDITRAVKTLPQSWWSWGAGKTGFSFGWVLTGSNALRVELYIDTGSKDENEAAFDRLHQEKEAIEGDLGGPLKWDRLDHRQASRISVSRPHTRITDAPEELEKAKQWTIETTLPFVDALRPRVQAL
jgi:hypothetical protein